MKIQIIYSTLLFSIVLFSKKLACSCDMDNYSIDYENDGADGVSTNLECESKVLLQILNKQSNQVFKPWLSVNETFYVNDRLNINLVAAYRDKSKNDTYALITIQEDDVVLFKNWISKKFPAINKFTNNIYNVIIAPDSY